jgi:dynein heavy chain 2
MQRAEQRTLLAEPINLSHLFHPETFLNALRQKSARQLKIAIDDLKLVSSFERNKLSGATVVQLEGLWLQGCEFDGKQLVDIRDEAGSELVAVPACHVGWIGHGDAGPYPESATVDTPVYLALDREAMLCTL